jgi:preprotein translocase subunit SecE
VARDRKRAKQRRARRGTTAGGRVESAPSQPVRTDVPGALEHASGDVDEFDAALVRGAGGVTVTPDSDLDVANGDSPATRDQIQSPPGGSGGGGSGDGGGGDDDAEKPSGAPLRGGGNRAINFLGASWAELQRVQWPDRRQVSQATAVVLGFVAIAGAYLGLADYVAKEIVEFIL